MVRQSRINFTYTHFSVASNMTSSTEINVTSSKILIKDPARQFEELFKTHLFFKNQRKNDCVMVLQSRIKSNPYPFSAPSNMKSSMEINVTPQRLQIAKFRLQILVGDLKSYSTRTYFV